MMPLTDQSTNAFIEAFQRREFHPMEEDQKASIPEVKKSKKRCRSGPSSSELHELSAATIQPQIDEVSMLTQAKGDPVLIRTIHLYDRAATLLEAAAKKHDTAIQAYQVSMSLDNETDNTRVKDFHSDMAQVLSDQSKITLIIAQFLRMNENSQTSQSALFNTVAVNIDSILWCLRMLSNSTIISSLKPTNSTLWLGSLRCLVATLNWLSFPTP